jgi:predicted N-acetyltransferase YhbS
MATRKSKHGVEALEVVSPVPRKHIEGILDLTAKAFGGPGSYYESVRNWRSDLLSNSDPYDWEASAVGLIDGRVLTHWAVMDYNMRIGRARVRVAGIGSVATHGDYRRRGLMAKTATASINRLRDHGYDLSILFGIDDFYHRFGYVRAWSSRKTRRQRAQVCRPLS